MYHVPLSREGRQFGMGRVTVVGSYVLALTMDTDRLPLEGETVRGRNYQECDGGKGSNMAACAARLGAQAAIIAKVGRDSFGQRFVAMLADEGVSREAVLYSENFSTAVGFIIFNSQGTNAIVIDMAANGDLTPHDVAAHEDLIRQSDVLLSPLEIPLETALAAAQLSHRHGKKFILNPAPATDLRGHDLSPLFALTPNETEARVCLGLSPNDATPDETLARRLLDLGPAHVMLTRGAAGVLWASHDGLQSMPAATVTTLDAVGAGDAFNAGLAVGLSEQRPLVEALALGVTTASLSTEKRLTIPSYPRREEVNPRVQAVLAGCHALPHPVR
jgi:ribokinase